MENYEDEFVVVVAVRQKNRKKSIVKIVSCSKSVTPHDRQSDSKRDKRGGRETDSKGVAR